MEKFAIVSVSIFVCFFLVGYIARRWARFAAGIEVLSYFDDGSYDPSEIQFHMSLKRLEHERRVSKGWVLGASIMLVTMTSGVFVPITELSQVYAACLSVIGIGVFVNIVLYVSEQFVADALRKKRVNNYASKLANPQY
jgi:hypothetical protein